VLAIQESGRDPDADDLSLYNRLGDLYLKIGDPATGADYFERAIERYAESGFENNAIALCNKVLRYAPGRTHVYLKLAKLMAHKGFTGEAKLHFLQYAERMQRAGQQDEAVSALRELTRIAPNAGELTALLDQYDVGSGRPSRSTQQDLVEPEYDVEAESPTSPRRKTKSLIFLDIEDTPAPPRAARPTPVSGLPLLEPTTVDRVAPPPPPTAASPPPAAPPAEEPEAEQLEEETAEAVASPAGPGETDELVDQSSEIESVDIEPTVLASDTAEGAPEVSLEGLELQEEFDRSLAQSGPIPMVSDYELVAPPSGPRLEGLESTTVDDVEEDRGEEWDAEPDYGTAPAVESDADASVRADVPVTAEEEEAEAPGMLDGMEFVESSGAEALVRDTPSDFEMGVEGITISGNIDFGQGDDDDLEAGAEPVTLDAPGMIDLDLDSLMPKTASIDSLEAAVLDDPDAPEPHLVLGEALIERGDRDRGLEELGIAVRCFDERNDLLSAREIAGEILRLEPNDIRMLQKLVEFAYRGGERAELVTAYLELGDALFRSGALNKALSVYERVIEHDAQNTRALAAMGMLRPPEEPKVEAKDARLTIRDEAPAGVAEFVDLGALILDDERRPRDTRMRVEDEAPTGDEARDFAEMLEQFRKGIGENLGEEDYQAHYDLGIAFKEMGLLDDAIAEFQKAMRGADVRLKTHEALGICFYEKGQYSVCEAILRRALDLVAAGDEERVGIIYWLARALEAQEQLPEALSLYRRVFAVNIRFEDVGARVRMLGRAGVP